MMTGQALIKTVSDTIDTPEELSNDDSSATDSSNDDSSDDSSDDSASEETETTPEEESSPEPSPDNGGGPGGKGRRRLRLITNYEDKLVNTTNLIDQDILPGAWTTMVEWMSSYDSNGYNDLL